MNWLSGKKGLMCHYLYPLLFDRNGVQVTDFNKCIDSFDVKLFAAQVEASKVDYVVFTIGQNSGFYIAPNPVIDKYAGPGHTSNRDLLGEIMDAVTSAGRKFIAYLPCEINANTTMHEGFLWQKEPGTDQKAFQERYLEMIDFWAKKYGEKLGGWWFDGCYTWDAFHSRYLDFEKWFAVLKKYNPQSVVAFNDGSFFVNSLEPVSPLQDYISGECLEIQDGFPVFAETGEACRFEGGRCEKNPGTIRNISLPIDALWWHGNFEEEIPGTRFKTKVPPSKMEDVVFSLDELQLVVDRFSGQGGAATFNLGITSDGFMSPQAVDLLSKLR